MVRKVVCNACAIALVAFLVPSIALAEPEEGISVASPDYSSQLERVIGRLDDIYAQNGNNSSGYDYTSQIDSVINRLDQMYTVQVQQNSKLDAIEKDVKPDEKEEVKKVEEESGPTEIDYLKSIDETLADIAEQEKTVEEEASPEVKAGSRAAATPLTAFTNVSPTSTYAEYSRGLLPRVSFSKHYVYLQDSQTSYMFIYGDVSESCRYT